LPLLGIVAGPAFAAAAQGRKEAGGAPGRSEAVAACVAGAFAAIAALSVLSHAPARSLAREAPSALLAALAAGGGTHVVFCGTVAYCDYAETVPGLRPFLDERVELASSSTLQAQEKIMRVRAGWREALRANGIDAMLVARTSSLAQLVGALPSWKAAGEDGENRLFVYDGGGR
jgi:hypothetical protein